MPREVSGGWGSPVATVGIKAAFDNEGERAVCMPIPSQGVLALPPGWWTLKEFLLEKDGAAIHIGFAGIQILHLE